MYRIPNIVLWARSEVKCSKILFNNQIYLFSHNYSDIDHLCLFFYIKLKSSKLNLPTPIPIFAYFINYFFANVNLTKNAIKITEYVDIP